MKKSKTFLKAAVLSLAAAMMLAACGGKSEETSGSSAKKMRSLKSKTEGKLSLELKMIRAYLA